MHTRTNQVNSSLQIFELRLDDRLPTLEQIDDDKDKKKCQQAWFSIPNCVTTIEANTIRKTFRSCSQQFMNLNLVIRSYEEKSNNEKFHHNNTRKSILHKTNTRRKVQHTLLQNTFEFRTWSIIEDRGQGKRALFTFAGTSWTGVISARQNRVTIWCFVCRLRGRQVRVQKKVSAIKEVRRHDEVPPEIAGTIMRQHCCVRVHTLSMFDDGCANLRRWNVCAVMSWMKVDSLLCIIRLKILNFRCFLTLVLIEYCQRSDWSIKSRRDNTTNNTTLIRLLQSYNLSRR